jgi:hypothetical protein
MVGKMYEKTSLALYRDVNFSLGKILNMECCSGKERSVTAWLLAGVLNLREIRKKSKEGDPEVSKKRWQTCIVEVFRN